MNLCFKYFRIDEIRGEVGKFPITPDFFLKLGWIIGKVLVRYGMKNILIGKDTRVSGCMLKLSIGSGLMAAGLSVVSVGLIPTPAIVYLTQLLKAGAGLSISASHNNFKDNGIKLFSNIGAKLFASIEQEIKKEFNNPVKCVNNKNIGQIKYLLDASTRYIEYCKKIFPKNLNLKGLKIVLDCANGSTYKVAPKIFESLGATIVNSSVFPNGININESCGTTNIKKLRNLVLLEKADLGLAFDGDGDRIVMIDHLGNKVNGDQILYILAKENLKKNILKGGVVGTLMSNSGLIESLFNLKIPFIRSQVGDRYVLEMMKKKGWNLGGESSGHVILLDTNETADGIITGLNVLAIMICNCKSLSQLCKNIVLVPQVLINVYQKIKTDWLKNKKLQRTIKKSKEFLGKKGRIVLRNSKTELCTRIMVEGHDQFLISILAHRIANVLKSI